MERLIFIALSIFALAVLATGGGVINAVIQIALAYVGGAA